MRQLGHQSSEWEQEEPCGGNKRHGRTVGGTREVQEDSERQ